MRESIACAVATLTASAALISCGAEPQSRYDYEPTKSIDATVSDEPTVTKGMTCTDAKLMNDVAKVFSNNCIRCHGPSPAPKAKFGKILDLEHIIKIGKVKPGKPATSILLKAVEDGAMPPSGNALSASEVASIRDWIKEGAPYSSEPENLGTFVKACSDDRGGAKAGDTDDETNEYGDNDDDDDSGNTGDDDDDDDDSGTSESIALRAAKILANNCQSCHDNGAALGGLGTITDLANLVADGYVVAKDTGDSELFLRMRDKQRPMPPKGLIDQQSIDVIAAWIDAGAPAQ